MANTNALDKVFALKLDGKIRIFDASAIDAEGWMVCYQIERGRCMTESHPVDLARWSYRALRKAGWTPCDPSEADENFFAISRAEQIDIVDAA